MRTTTPTPTTTTTTTIAATPLRAGRRGKRSGKRTWSSGTLLQACLAIATGTVFLGVVRIESVLYREFRDTTTRRAEEDSPNLSGKRHRSSGGSESEYQGNDEGGGTSDGLVRRSTESRPMIAREAGHDKPRPRLVSGSRIVALNEHLERATMPAEIGRKMARTIQMELEDTSAAADGYDHYGGHLEFEREYYDQCDPVLDPLPKVHPTCNSIHELFLSTELENERSSLLSMKGAWRSVWKVDLNTVDNDIDKMKTNTTALAFAQPDSNNSTIVSSNKSTSTSSAVLKMLHLHRRFDHQSFEAHATDSIAMDRLTASPYVVDAYGFCGQSVVTEFAEVSGRDYVKRYDIGSRDRLRIARDLARGLADIQALRALPHAELLANATKNATTIADLVRDYDVDRGTGIRTTTRSPIVFAHNDITIANTVMVDGRIKWNDFNIGIFLRRPKRKNDDSGRKLHRSDDSGSRRHLRSPDTRSSSNHRQVDDESADAKVPPSKGSQSLSFRAFTEENSGTSDEALCPAPVKFRSDMWRSPEEIRNTSYVQMTQTDVYGLGNIIYQTMTRHQPWTYKEPGGALTKEDVAVRKQNGTIPTIPEQYLNTTKRELQTLFAATNLCFFHDPWKRPTARRLAFGLGSLYNRVSHKKGVTRLMILDYLVP
ncbi:unnamed protein product [Pseudo-nitzschia multistriata]|uniref:Protein kinase domain-containing protein n=1 Tax=Pseudo-nitzschia multistriata TaxID=183589 RepID=A0A448Z3U2_9STRA|nr:unnamed protein product [Pseudo-nitzschia multistriata]